MGKITVMARSPADSYDGHLLPIALYTYRFSVPLTLSAWSGWDSTIRQGRGAERGYGEVKGHFLCIPVTGQPCLLSKMTVCSPAIRFNIL